jgi:hypothetical protein
MPLVNAVKELKAENEEQQSQIDDLKKKEWSLRNINEASSGIKNPRYTACFG